MQKTSRGRKEEEEKSIHDRMGWQQREREEFLQKEKKTRREGMEMQCIYRSYRYPQRRFQSSCRWSCRSGFLYIEIDRDGERQITFVTVVKIELWHSFHSRVSINGVTPLCLQSIDLSVCLSVYLSMSVSGWIYLQVIYTSLVFVLHQRNERG